VASSELIWHPAALAEAEEAEEARDYTCPALCPPHLSPRSPGSSTLSEVHVHIPAATRWQPGRRLGLCRSPHAVQSQNEFSVFAHSCCEHPQVTQYEKQRETSTVVPPSTARRLAAES
jgi:hypothetical protein